MSVRLATLGSTVALAAALAAPALGGGGSGDETTAVLKAVSVRPERVDSSAGDTSVTVRVRATSDIGLQSVYAEFMNRRREVPIPLPGESYEPVRGTDRNGVWRVQVEVPHYSVKGRWRLESVKLSEDHKARIYFADELERLGMRESFFQTGEGDNEPPSLRSFEVNPTEFDSSQRTFQINVDLVADDNLSGVDMVEVGASGPVDLGAVGWFYDPASTHRTFTGPAPLAPRPKPGTYSVYVRLRDRTGNLRVYRSAELAASGWTSKLVWH